MYDDAHPWRLDDQRRRLLIGGGLYSSFVVFPQFAQLPRVPASASGLRWWFRASTCCRLHRDGGVGEPRRAGFRRRYGSKLALIAGTWRSLRGVPVVGASTWPSLRHPDHQRASGYRHRTLVLGPRQPDRRRRGAPSDGRGHRHEHRHANAGGRARRPDLCHLHRRPRAPPPPTVTGFTETYLMATGFVVAASHVGLLIPVARAAWRAQGRMTSSRPAA